MMCLDVMTNHVAETQRFDLLKGDLALKSTTDSTAEKGGKK